MNAYLTTDGTIKIISSTNDDESKFGQNKTKEIFLSKEISRSQQQQHHQSDSDESSSKFSESSKENQSIDLKKGPSELSQCDDDDDGQFLEYKQIPRRVFMTTICQVSLSLKFKRKKLWKSFENLYWNCEISISQFRGYFKK